MCKRRKLFLSFLARHDASGVIFALFSGFFHSSRMVLLIPTVRFVHACQQPRWVARPCLHYCVSILIDSRAYHPFSLLRLFLFLFFFL